MLYTVRCIILLPCTPNYNLVVCPNDQRSCLILSNILRTQKLLLRLTLFFAQEVSVLGPPLRSSGPALNNSIIYLRILNHCINLGDRAKYAPDSIAYYWWWHCGTQLIKGFPEGKSASTDRVSQKASLPQLTVIILNNWYTRCVSV